jgi:hypothetical protein
MSQVRDQSGVKLGELAIGGGYWDADTFFQVKTEIPGARRVNPNQN